MGEVHVFHDERLARDVAVKILRGPMSEDGARRFAREALLQARLEHPAFVPVYDFAAEESGEVRLTMRRVKGRTLREVLHEHAAASGPVPSRHRLLAAFTQLCLAVDYAHTRGVVHRDIKPENVMLGDFGEVYLLDWGIAKVLGEAEDPALHPSPGTSRPQAPLVGTVEGAMLGTLGYMPPEQLMGQHALVDARTDIYALGAVLFELLALEPMHAGRAIPELLQAALEGKDRSAAERAPTREVPPELDALCQRATEPERERRFESARALAEAVERFLEGDRDLALRRQRAAALSQHAREKLASAQDSVRERVEAGQEAARAIALDPELREARETLLAALAEPPKNPPAEVVEAVEAGRGEAQVRLFQVAGMGALLMNLLGALVLASTARLLRPALAWSAVLVPALSAILLLSARWTRRREAVILAGWALMCTGHALGAPASSPFIMAPAVAIGSGTAALLFAPASQRLLRMAMALGVVLLPYLLQRVGVVAAGWSWSPTEIRLVPLVAPFPPSWMLVAHFSLLTCVAGWAVIFAMNRAHEIDLRARSQSWMLRRVLDLE